MTQTFASLMLIAYAKAIFDTHQAQQVYSVPMKHHSNSPNITHHSLCSKKHNV